MTIAKLDFDATMRFIVPVLLFSGILAFLAGLDNWNLSTIIGDSGIGRFAPIAWVADLVLLWMAGNFITCMILNNSDAVFVRDGLLIFLSRIYFSVPVEEIVAIAADDTSKEFPKITIRLKSGRSKTIYTRPLKLPPSEIAEAIRASLRIGDVRA